ncbi:hypothetical protein DFP72DRAFT_1131414 [Ephemerocybe angulata]|uniref:GST N-terminal domain-containing protein n=1 Tax=Ephemerocybe angulata TaxID=980116 RepID=A0A8H6HUC1_9AGAR|nr:hypothetical protein DFP72DRAFT_1131414 [Tulosesus angulatus]
MLTLYDFKIDLPEKSISPGAMKVRMVLNYKNLPYKNVWIPYHEIQKRFTELGFGPNDLEPKPDGTFRYTVPILHDSSTNQVISDSLRIIHYLDETYPEAPRVIEPGTKLLAVTLEQTAVNTASAEKFRFTIETFFLEGTSIETFLADKKLEDAKWVQAEAGLTALDGFFKKAELATEAGQGDKLPFINGKNPSYPDFALGSLFVWMERGMRGADRERWERITSLNNGRWGALYEGLRPYLATH